MAQITNASPKKLGTLCNIQCRAIIFAQFEKPQRAESMGAAVFNAVKRNQQPSCHWSQRFQSTIAPSARDCLD